MDKKELMMMRIRGLSSTFLSRHKGITGLSKSKGAAIFVERDLSGRFSIDKTTTTIDSTIITIDKVSV